MPSISGAFDPMQSYPDRHPIRPEMAAALAGVRVVGRRPSADLHGTVALRQGGFRLSPPSTTNP
jgi:hypothetical protein